MIPDALLDADPALMDRVMRMMAIGEPTREKVNQERNHYYHDPHYLRIMDILTSILNDFSKKHNAGDEKKKISCRRYWI